MFLRLGVKQAAAQPTRPATAAPAANPATAAATIASSLPHSGAPPQVPLSVGAAGKSHHATASAIMASHSPTMSSGRSYRPDAVATAGTISAEVLLSAWATACRILVRCSSLKSVLACRMTGLPGARGPASAGESAAEGFRRRNRRRTRRGSNC